MIKVNIAIDDDLYPAEKMYERLSFLNVGQFSSFFWRLLHWMAEAVMIREEKMFIKKIWRELVIECVYRLLSCGICMYHLKEMTAKLALELMDESKDFARLWFDMHNEVHKQRREQYNIVSEIDYSEEDYKLDAEFMRQALVSAK